MKFNSKDFVKDVRSLDDFIQKASNGKLDIESFRKSVELTADYWIKRNELKYQRYLKIIFDEGLTAFSKKRELYRLFDYPLVWTLCSHKFKIYWADIHHAWQKLLDNYNFPIAVISDFNKLPIYNENNPIYITDDERRIMQSVSVIDKDKLKNLKEIV